MPNEPQYYHCLRTQWRESACKWGKFNGAEDWRNSEVLRNVGILRQHCTVSTPRRPRLESSLPWKLKSRIRESSWLYLSFLSALQYYTGGKLKLFLVILLSPVTLSGQLAMSKQVFSTSVQIFCRLISALCRKIRHLEYA